MGSDLTRRRFLAACGVATAGTAMGQRRLTSNDGHLQVFLEAKDSWVPVAGRPVHLWTYNGLMPGPLIELWPGDTLQLKLRNSLAEHTNIHFHGLHVSPGGNGDNPFLMIPPAEEFEYEIAIPASHPAGTFWYHPHVHGNTARQVFRGLSGVIIVRGDLDEIPEVAVADEHVLVLKDLAVDRDGQVRDASMMDRMSGREGPLLTVNGEVGPSYPIRRGGLTRWRFVNASSSRYYRLSIEDHPFAVIAVDGGMLARTEMQQEALLTPGQRLDVLVKADRPAGVYRLLNLPYDRGGFAQGSAAAPQELARLVYAEDSDSPMQLPEVLGYVERLPAPQSPPRHFELQQGMMGTFGINGRTFRADRVDTQVGLGTVEDWVIHNAGQMDHPFHLHVNPFQIVEADETIDRAAWLDVINVPGRSSRRIRIRFADFAGKTVYHCHILDHEDGGMMGTLEIA